MVKSYSPHLDDTELPGPVRNSTFEGAAREQLRARLNTYMH